MIFGISGSIFFVHFPFVKLYDIPLTAYRDFPRTIINRCARRLDFKIRFIRYRNETRAMTELDSLIEQHGCIGLQTSVYWLTYFPPRMRFHFNGHNILIYGKTGNDYLVSDPVLDKPVVCPGDSLKRARFGKGIFAPRGTVYFPLSLPNSELVPQAILQGIDHACKRMLYIFLPWFGTRGIAFLGKSILKWPQKLNHERKVRAYVGNVFRMQEEIGTGGAGFRFMYASFLQESAQWLNAPELNDFSSRMTEIGDLWQEFALQAGRICKDREHLSSLNLLSDILRDLSLREHHLFKNLHRFIRQYRKKNRMEKTTS